VRLPTSTSSWAMPMPAGSSAWRPLWNTWPSCAMWRRARVRHGPWLQGRCRSW